MAFLKRLLRAFPLLVLSPLLMAASALALALTDLLWKLFGRTVPSAEGTEGPLPRSPEREYGHGSVSALPSRDREGAVDTLPNTAASAPNSETRLPSRAQGAPREGAPCPDAGAAPATAASVVIPNWNGKDLLAKYLPSVVAALAGNPANEIVVVDNGSTDGSARIRPRGVPAGEAGGARPAIWVSAADRTPDSARPRTTSWCC